MSEPMSDPVDPMRDSLGQDVPASHEEAGASGTTAEGGASTQPAAPAEGMPAAAEDASQTGTSAMGADESDVDMSAFAEQLEDSDLAEAMGRIAQLDEDLARAKADLYNLNREYSNYVRRSKESAGAHRDSGRTDVLEALVGVLDDIDAARRAGDLADGPFASIANKLEDTLRTRFQLERYGAEGDDFDPQLHEALMARTAEVDHPVVGQLLQPGYRIGERVLRAAKVLVDNPE